MAPGTDRLPRPGRRHRGRPHPATGGDRRAPSSIAGDELHRGRAVAPRRLPPERGAQGQAGPGGGDRL